jgi:RNA polymerase sigma factor (sigma-70 family)
MTPRAFLTAREAVINLLLRNSSNATGDSCGRQSRGGWTGAWRHELMLRRSFRKPAWKPSGGYPNISSRTRCHFISGFIGSREPSPSQALATTELAERLRLALRPLDDDERDLILWRHFEQLSARDTALLLRISEAAASKRYIRAVERLRKILVGLGVSGHGLT